jgi:autotransporter translocation and assembly factor TamB
MLKKLLLISSMGMLANYALAASFTPGTYTGTFTQTVLGTNWVDSNFSAQVNADGSLTATIPVHGIIPEANLTVGQVSYVPGGGCTLSNPTITGKLTVSDVTFDSCTVQYNAQGQPIQVSSSYSAKVSIITAVPVTGTVTLNAPTN